MRGLRSPPRLPYTPLPEPLHPLTRGSAGRQTEAGDIIGSHIKQFDGYTATKLIVAELQPLQVGEVAQFRRYRPAQLVVAEVQISNAPVGVSANAVPAAIFNETSGEAGYSEMSPLIAATSVGRSGIN